MADSHSEYDSDLNSQELDSRTTEAQPQNTRKSTSWAVSVYRRWAARRQQHIFIKPDLLDYNNDTESLNKALFKFYNEAHTIDKEAFTPSSLQVCTYTQLQKKNFPRLLCRGSFQHQAGLQSLER